MALADNAVASANLHWNEEELRKAKETWDVLPEDWGVELPKFEEERQKEIHAKLKDKFITPPFSIIDSRRGYWLERKRQWNTLNLKSDEGRKEDLVLRIPERMKEYTGVDMNGTSIFDPVLAEINYKWFCPEGGTIYDCFAGGSVRGIVAEMCGYKYNGIDLRQEQIEANKQTAERIGVKPTWYCDDSQNVDKYIKDETIDFVFSCPPYYDLEVYSDNEKDLSNMEWDEFVRVYENIIKKAVAKLKNNRFASFVVGDIRDRKGLYRDFIGVTKKAFEKAGAHLYNDMVYIEPLGTAPARATRFFNGGRKVCKTHQNILVFYKGDTKEIKNNFAPIDYTGEDFFNDYLLGETENELK